MDELQQYFIIIIIFLQVFFSVVVSAYNIGNAIPELESFSVALAAASAIFPNISTVSITEKL